MAPVNTSQLQETERRCLDELVAEVDSRDGHGGNGKGNAQARPDFSNTDDAIIERARKAANGSKFVALFDAGDTSQHDGDHSSADAALMTLLAYWCEGDAEQMERIFALSALAQRDKWRGREDYRQNTIKAAIEFNGGKRPERLASPGSERGAPNGHCSNGKGASDQPRANPNHDVATKPEFRVLKRGDRVLCSDRPGTEPNIGTVMEDYGSSCRVHFKSQSGHEAEEVVSKSDMKTLDGRSLSVGESDLPEPVPISASVLFEQAPELRPVVIPDLLRKGEIANIIAPPKAGKSWLVLFLALAKALGLPWLGRFQLTPGRVLLIDNELHAETLASRMQRMASALDVSVDDYAANLDVLPIRGMLRDLASLEKFFESIEGQYELVIMDAWYRFYGADFDENSNSDVTRAFNLLDSYAAECGAAFALSHHMSKGSQDGKSTTDLGSGAGAQSRAADTHIGLRADPSLGPDYLTVEAAVRSFPPLDPFVIRRQHPLWLVDSLAPRAAGGKRAPMDPKAFVDKYADTTPRTKRELIERATDAGETNRRASATLEAAISDGLLSPWKARGEHYAKYANRPQPQPNAMDEATGEAV